MTVLQLTDQANVKKCLQTNIRRSGFARQFSVIRRKRMLLGLIITIAVLGCLPGIGADDIILATGVTVRFTCTGPGLPAWFLNETFAAEEEQCYRLNFSKSEELIQTSTLAINGNLTCGTFNIHCKIQVSEVEVWKLHNISLAFRGCLPSPGSVYINESVNASNIGSVIEWTPPYSAMNNQTVHVDPHITHYTVYITDNHTGGVVKVNVTETHFTINQGNIHCPMYQVSAWNAAGEGELSEPVQPHIPRKIATGKVDILRIAASHMLHIYFNVSELCKMRTPNYFVITVTNSSRTINTTTVSHDHQSGSQVTIRIELPRNVDMCSLVVSIRAGNSAGMSFPTEIEVGPTNCSESIAAITSGTDATKSVEAPSEKKGLVGVAVGGVSIAAVILVAVVVVIVWKHKRKSKVKNSGSEMDQNTKSQSFGGHPPTQAECESTSSENTRTGIPVTGSSTDSNSGADLI